MRITNAQTNALVQQAISSNSQALARLQAQMASGLRLLQPSDDPVASMRILRLQREEAASSQYRKNIVDLTSQLNIQETNLTAGSQTLHALQEKLLWAANDANSDKDKAAIAAEMHSQLDALFDVVNARDEEGRYLFSGTLSSTPALSRNGATYLVTGNGAQRQAVVGNEVQMPANVTAEGIFGSSADFFNAMAEAIDSLQNNPTQAGAKVDAALKQLDGTQDQLLRAVTDLGGRQNTLALLEARHDGTSLTNRSTESELQSLDYSQAYLDQQSHEVAMQASQKTWMKVSQLSLFELI